MHNGVLELSTKGDVELFLRYGLFPKCFLSFKYAVWSYLWRERQMYLSTKNTCWDSKWIYSISLIRDLHSNSMQAINEMTWLILSQSPMNICLPLKSSTHNCSLCSGEAQLGLQEVLQGSTEVWSPVTAWTWHCMSTLCLPWQLDPSVFSLHTTQISQNDSRSIETPSSLCSWVIVCHYRAVTMFLQKANDDTFSLSERRTGLGISWDRGP